MLVSKHKRRIQIIGGATDEAYEASMRCMRLDDGRDRKERTEEHVGGWQAHSHSRPHPRSTVTSYNVERCREITRVPPEAWQGPTARG